MTTENNLFCPECGNRLLPGALMGLCPRCLLRTQGSGVAERFSPPALEELAPFFPQLELLETLGHGGMGAVYKARQRELDRLIAVKILPLRVGGSEAERAAFESRFTREAKALAKLNHPNIVTLYDFGKVDGLFYFFMEYVEGMNLRELMSRGRLETHEALAIVPQICQGLQYAHDQGIVHRDIKPENILLRRDGVVKIADFGVAKIMMGEDAAALGGIASGVGVTEAGKVFGTPPYMAPEQAANAAEVDHRADIYSLGVVFYQMLTGKLPENEAPGVAIDIRLNEIVLRALEKRPERRYARVEGLMTDVQTVAGTYASEGTKEAKKRQYAKFLIPLEAAVFIGAGLLLGWFTRKATPPMAVGPGASPSPVTSVASDAANTLVEKQVEIKVWPGELYSFDGREIGLDGLRSELTRLWVEQLSDHKLVGITLATAKGVEQNGKAVEALKDLALQSELNTPETLKGETNILSDEGPPYSRFQIRTGADEWSESEMFEDLSGEKLRLTPNIPISERDLESVRASKEPDEVILRFTPRGMKKFALLTQRNIGKELFLLLDGKVFIHPRVNMAIYGQELTLSLKDKPAVRDVLLHLLDEKDEAVSKETQALLDEPPVLKAIGWQDWIERGKESAWKPDGSSVSDVKDALFSCGRSTSGNDALRRPRVLILAFSHPLLDIDGSVGVELLDETGKKNLAASVMSRSSSAGRRRGQGWLCYALSTDIGMEGPSHAMAELRYAIGPWTKKKDIGVDNYSGYSSTEFHLGMVGDGPDGKAFIQLINSRSFEEGQMIGVLAVLDDGGKIRPTRSSSGSSSNNSSEKRFFFDVPLKRVKGFECRTRPIRKIQVPIVLNYDPHESGAFAVTFDGRGKTMGEIVEGVARHYKVRLCFEKAEAGDAKMLKQVSAGSLGEFLDTVTEGTPYQWRRYGKTWVVTPKANSRLDYFVTLDLHKKSLRECVEALLQQAPKDSLSLASGMEGSEMDWTAMDGSSIYFQKASAVDVLCLMTEENLPDFLWRVEAGTLFLQKGVEKENGMLEAAARWLQLLDAGDLDKVADNTLDGRDAKGVPEDWITRQWRAGIFKGKLLKRAPRRMQSHYDHGRDAVTYTIEFDAVFEKDGKWRERVSVAEGPDGRWRPFSFYSEKEP